MYTERRREESVLRPTGSKKLSLVQHQSVSPKDFCQHFTLQQPQRTMSGGKEVNNWNLSPHIQNDVSI